MAFMVVFRTIDPLLLLLLLLCVVCCSQYCIFYCRPSPVLLAFSSLALDCSIVCRLRAPLAFCRIQLLSTTQDRKAGRPGCMEPHRWYVMNFEAPTTSKFEASSDAAPDRRLLQLDRRALWLAQSIQGVERLLEEGIRLLPREKKGRISLIQEAHWYQHSRSTHLLIFRVGVKHPFSVVKVSVAK